MPTDLESQLHRLFRPPDVSSDGLNDVKIRGARIRRRRRSAGIGVALAACLAGVLAVSALRAPSGQPVTVGPTSSLLPATPRSSSTSEVAEPATLVAELGDAKVGVVSTRTGRVLRVLTPVAHDAFGTLGVGGRVFYYETFSSETEPGCRPGPCAINTVTAVAHSVTVNRWRWTAHTPVATAIAVSPDGRHGAAEPTGQSLETAGVNTAPQSFGLSAQRQYDSGSFAWTPDSRRVVVATSKPNAAVAFDLLVVDVATGTTRDIRPAAQCNFVGMPALSATKLFEQQQCGHVQQIAVINLATGNATSVISLPRGAQDLLALAADPTGTHLIASATAQVWTEHAGTWTRLPHLSGVYALAW